jgi:TolB-like protein/Flp pilus assembly protein TadD
MSPEQARNDPLDHRTDIFSLGAVLYELLTGRPPFSGDRPATVLYAIETATPPAPSTLEPEVPAAVDRIVLAMLAKDPDRRPATAAAASDALADPSRARLGRATGRRPRMRVPASGAVVAAAVALLVTLGAVAWILNGRGDTRGAERVMVAVIPFENLGVAADEYLADGVTDEIIGRLVAVPGLGVISRTSSRRYQGTDKPTATIGRELGVAYLLQGTIRWEGGATGTVRVTPELIRVADDTQIWAQHYDRGMDDLFQIQTEIAERVAAALNLSLLASTRQEMAARPNASFEAYRAYQRGRVAARNAPYSAESLALAVALFQRAVDLDPGFALAHAMLARMHAQAYHAGHDRTTARLARAEASAGRALELAPDLPEARLAHAYYRYWGLHDYDAALAELNAIPDHRTGNAEVLAARGYILRRQGRIREAAGSLRRALELDPRNDVLAVELANTYLGMWQFDRAETFYDLAISLAPDAAAPYTLKVRNRLLWTGDLRATRAVLDGMPAGHEIRHLYFLAFQALCEGDHARVVELLSPRRAEIYETHAQAVPLALVMAWAHERSGDPAAARQAYRLAGEQLTATVDRRPDDFRTVMALGLVSAGLGDREAARRYGERALALNPVANDAWSSPIMQRNLLILQAAVGDVEAALATLRTLLATPNPGLSPALARLEPRLAGLREDPRFELIVARAEGAHPAP